MNRSITAVLGGCAALALTAAGLTTASATEPTPPSPEHPVVSERITFDDKTIFPKNRVCKDKIIAREKGAFKVINYGQVRGKAKLKFVFENWSYGKFSNPRTGNSVKVGEGGDGVLRISSKGVAKGRGQGQNVFLGKGVHGIVYTEGPVRFTLTKFGTEQERATIDAVHGKYVQLCTKLGSRPVLGKVNTYPEGQGPEQSQG